MKCIDGLSTCIFNSICCVVLFDLRTMAIVNKQQMALVEKEGSFQFHRTKLVANRKISVAGHLLAGIQKSLKTVDWQRFVWTTTVNQPYPFSTWKKFQRRCGDGLQFPSIFCPINTSNCFPKEKLRHRFVSLYRTNNDRQEEDIKIASEL